MKQTGKYSLCNEQKFPTGVIFGTGDEGAGENIKCYLILYALGIYPSEAMPICMKSKAGTDMLFTISQSLCEE